MAERFIDKLHVHYFFRRTHFYRHKRCDKGCTGWEFMRNWGCSSQSKYTKYSWTPSFRTRVCRSPRYFELIFVYLCFALPFWVILPLLFRTWLFRIPCYFELFSLSLSPNLPALFWTLISKLIDKHHAEGVRTKYDKSSYHFLKYELHNLRSTATKSQKHWTRNWQFYFLLPMQFRFVISWQTFVLLKVICYVYVLLFKEKWFWGCPQTIMNVKCFEIATNTYQT